VDGGHQLDAAAMLTVLAQGLDELVFGHRGATLDAGLFGPLA
jgi:hypothetical protein